MSKTTKQKVWTIKTLPEGLGWGTGSIDQKAKHVPPPIASVNKGLRVRGDDQFEAIAKIVGKNPGRGRPAKGGVE